VGGLVWSGGAWNSFWTTIRLSLVAAPLTAAVGLLIAYLLAVEGMKRWFFRRFAAE